MKGQWHNHGESEWSVDTAEWDILKITTKVHVHVIIVTLDHKSLTEKETLSRYMYKNSGKWSHMYKIKGIPTTI